MTTYRVRKTGTKPPTKYHTDETCRHYPDDGRDIALSEVESRGLQECKYCSGEYEPNACDSHKYIRRIQQARGDD